MAVVRRPDLAAGRDIPLPHRPVRGGRYQARSVRTEGGPNDFAGVPLASGQQRAGRRVPNARPPVLAARDEPLAIWAEGVRPDCLAVAIADRRLAAGSRIEHEQPKPLTVWSEARQALAVRAHGNGPPPLGSRHRHTTKGLAGLAQQVKGSLSDPRYDSQPAVGLCDGGRLRVLNADWQTPVLTSQVRYAHSSARYLRDPEPVGGTSHETSTLGGQWGQ